MAQWFRILYLEWIPDYGMAFAIDLVLTAGSKRE